MLDNKSLEEKYSPTKKMIRTSAYLNPPTFPRKSKILVDDLELIDLVEA